MILTLWCWLGAKRRWRTSRLSIGHDMLCPWWLLWHLCGYHPLSVVWCNYSCDSVTSMIIIIFHKSSGSQIWAGPGWCFVFLQHHLRLFLEPGWWMQNNFTQMSDILACVTGRLSPVDDSQMVLHQYTALQHGGLKEIELLLGLALIQPVSERNWWKLPGPFLAYLQKSQSFAFSTLYWVKQL